jgi:cytoskeleton protein RodZ
MPTQDLPRDFGRYLQACRLAKHISLEAVAQQTKIPMASLRMIEDEDVAHLPAPPFVKGFLRAYAATVGADAAEAMRRYAACCGGAEQSRRSQTLSRPRQGFWLRLLVACALVAAVIAATLAAALGMQHRKTTGNAAHGHAAGQAPAKNLPARQHVSPAVPAESSAAKQEAAPPERESLILEIAALEPTHVKVIVDEQKAQEFALKQEDKVTLKARARFSLLIGNAVGVQLTLNGRSVPVPGKRGQIVTVQLP